MVGGMFMRSSFLHRSGCLLLRLLVTSCSLACLLCLPLSSSAADLVEMKNGDRYVGKILSMDTNQVVLLSDVLGKITLPREKVANLNLGSVLTNARPKTQAAATNLSPASVPVTNGTTDLAGAFRTLGTNQNALKSIRQQYLLEAGPEANAKFDELLGGVMSGKVSMNDLRNQAKSAADQLRQFKRELGNDAGSELDGYLAILDHFLDETKPNTVSTSPPPATATPARN